MKKNHICYLRLQLLSKLYNRKINSQRDRQFTHNPLCDSFKCDSLIIPSAIHSNARDATTNHFDGFAHYFFVAMVKRWNVAATKILRQKIDSGEITLNNDSAQYLGDIVSGEFFPEYEAPPPSGRQTAIVRFRRLFRRIKLSRELQGQRLAARQGKLSIWNCLFDERSQPEIL